MKRTAILALMVALVPMAGAVVNHSGGNGDMNIMDGGSTSASGASQAVGPNGTMWRAEVTGRDASCLSGNASAVTDVNWSTASSPDGGEEWRTVSFRGTLQAADPCHTIGHEVEEVDGGYVLRLETEDVSGACVQCVGGISYGAEFAAPGPYTLEVRRGNETLRTLESPGAGADGGTIAGLIAFLVSLLA